MLLDTQDYPYVMDHRPISDCPFQHRWSVMAANQHMKPSSQADAQVKILLTRRVSDIIITLQYYVKILIEQIKPRLHRAC